MWSLTLQLVCLSGDGYGLEIYQTDTTWTEGSITANNAPPFSGSPVASVASVASGDTVSFDVSGVVTANGVYSFALVAAAEGVFGNEMSFGSKESADIPFLRVEAPLMAKPAVRAQDTETVLPTVFSLMQNYPNPFNPETVIRFSVSRRSAVEVTVYSILGQPVSKLVRGVYPAGYHSVIWNGRDDNGRDVPSGVYVYVMEVAGKTFIKKMTLIR